MNDNIKTQINKIIKIYNSLIRQKIKVEKEGKIQTEAYEKITNLKYNQNLKELQEYKIKTNIILKLINIFNIKTITKEEIIKYQSTISKIEKLIKSYKKNNKELNKLISTINKNILKNLQKEPELKVENKISINKLLVLDIKLLELENKDNISIYKKIKELDKIDKKQRLKLNKYIYNQTLKNRDIEKIKNKILIAIAKIKDTDENKKNKFNILKPQELIILITKTKQNKQFQELEIKYIKQEKIRQENIQQEKQQENRLETEIDKLQLLINKNKTDNQVIEKLSN